MDEQELELSPQKEGAATPALPAQPEFTAAWKEILAALAMYVLAWYYFDIFLLEWQLALFTLGFIALTELIHWERRRPWESYVWLGCVLVILSALLLRRCNAWEDYFLPGLLLHVFAVWWALSRSGRLAEGESGHLLPMDALNGFVVFPFKHFFLRIRTLWYGLTHIGRRGSKPKTETLVWTALSTLAAVILFVMAVNLLMSADEGFNKLLSGIFTFDWDDVDLLRFIFSLPVAAYLFGLIAGTGREDEEKLRARGGALRRWVESLRKVPNRVFTVLIGAFALLYLAFFLVQGSYLFGAFTRTLPEGFVVAQYARRGFFELCRVMTVNFALLWLVTRLSAQPVRENKAALIACLVLLAESLLFAVIAFSKLALYMDCFGFTPLRLESTWLVCVLAFGCLCAGYSLLTGKKSMRVWMIFGAVSVSLLCLY